MCCCSEKAFQNQGIESKLVQSLVEDLEHRSLPCFNDKPTEEIVVGSWDCPTGFPDPTKKSGILVHSL